MSVTNQNPTEVGQRVQEPYGDTQGQVIGFNGNEVLVAWDQPDSADAEVGNFEIDELRVVTES